MGQTSPFLCSFFLSSQLKKKHLIFSMKGQTMWKIKTRRRSLTGTKCYQEKRIIGIPQSWQDDFPVHIQVIRYKTLYFIYRQTMGRRERTKGAGVEVGRTKAGIISGRLEKVGKHCSINFCSAQLSPFYQIPSHSHLPWDSLFPSRSEAGISSPFHKDRTLP